MSMHRLVKRSRLIAAVIVGALVIAGIAYGAIPHGATGRAAAPVAAAAAPSSFRMFTASFTNASCGALATIPASQMFVITQVLWQTFGGVNGKLFSGEGVCTTQLGPDAQHGLKWTFTPGIPIAPGSTISVSMGTGDLIVWVYGYLAAAP
jgi:hypothetical protein